MKINLIIPSFYPATIYGGPIFSTLNTCKELVKIDDVEVYVSTTNANMTTRLDVETNRFIELEKNLFVKYYHETIINKLSSSLLFNIWRDIKKCDVVHSQVIYRPMTPIVFIYSIIMKKPVLYSPRGALGAWLLNNRSIIKKIWLKIFLSPFSKSIFWHATAQQEKDEILTLFPNAKVHIIPNGINLDDYRTINKLSKREYIKKYTDKNIDAEYILISMGRLHAKKGFDILIDSFSQLNHKFSNSILLIAGEDETEKENLEKQIKNLKLENRVFLIGSVSGQDKIDFLANADLFVLPSHNENFGNVYAESLASGTAVIATENTPWEEVEKYNCGKWVKNSIDEIKNTIEDILEKEYIVMGQNGKEYISKFEWKNIAKDFLDLYSKIKEENGK